MDFVLILVVMVVAVAIVAYPLLRSVRPGDEHPASDLVALEIAKEDKFREIRDAELDRRTGKLSEEDWHKTDAALRAEAVTIMRAIEAASDGEPPEAQQSSEA